MSKSHRTERPILFSGPMVQAIQDNRKTMTRRAIKPNRRKDGVQLVPELLQNIGVGHACPYGAVGDRLWVRETFLELRREHYHIPGKPRDWIEPYSGRGRRNACAYRADCTSGDSERCRIELGYHKWTPAIHMPRWASRYTLEIVRVSVERLQSITFEDIAAEGINDAAAADPTIVKTAENYGMSVRRYLFSSVWEKINGAGSWEANPWVWVIEFRRVSDAVRLRKTKRPLPLFRFPKASQAQVDHGPTQS